MELPTEWILGIAASFATAATAVWGYIKSQNKALVTRMDNQAERLEGKLDKCEERHIERDERDVELARKIGKLEGAQQMAMRVEDITKELIKEVRANK